MVLNKVIYKNVLSVREKFTQETNSTQRNVEQKSQSSNSGNGTLKLYKSVEETKKLQISKQRLQIFINRKDSTYDGKWYNNITKEKNTMNTNNLAQT